MTFNEAIDGIFKLIQVSTPFALAWIAYKQNRIDKKVNGHISRLMLAADEGNVNKGRLEEKKEHAQTTADLNEKLVEASKQIPVTDTPAEVKVINEDPITVEVKKNGNKT